MTDLPQDALRELRDEYERAGDYWGEGPYGIDEELLKRFDAARGTLQSELAALRQRCEKFERDYGAATIRLGQLADQRNAAIARAEQAERDALRLDYIERTFSGMTNRERYLPVQMIWGKGSNGRTLREACDKYMAREAANTNGGRQDG
ncbi:hypothetical protein [Noviluteimonas gilva]|uniref:Uncharacterized protein n=1 Tax=Noviluteimonas gilva TaxID=2682097 RepID=A0A7C9MLH2_9GAMM|nr:hypothetical protein [Lysobacter gilvus]MUV13527.1 hypothetical protein [Lysobacter gilvus]